ncbi:MAG: hypothetical protein HYY63_05305, partial [Elusimicrobia bacterium]|nr:hypothetical protein [Elusimicrobiota bacterium]
MPFSKKIGRTFKIGEGHESQVTASRALLAAYSKIPGILLGHTHLEGGLENVAPSGADAMSQANLKTGKRGMIVLGMAESSQDAVFTVTTVNKIKLKGGKAAQWQVTVSYYQNLEDPRLIHIGSLSLKQYPMTQLLFSLVKKHARPVAYQNSRTPFDFFAELAKRELPFAREMEETENSLDLDAFLNGKQFSVLTAQRRISQALETHRYTALAPEIVADNLSEVLGAVAGGIGEEVEKEVVRGLIEARENAIAANQEKESFGTQILSGMRGKRIDAPAELREMFEQKEWKKEEMARLSQTKRRKLVSLMARIMEAYEVEEGLKRLEGVQGDWGRFRSAKREILTDEEWKEFGLDEREESFYKGGDVHTIYLRSSALTSPLKLLSLSLRESAHAFMPDSAQRHSTRAELYGIAVLERALKSQAQDPVTDLIVSRLELDLLLQLQAGNIENKPLEVGRAWMDAGSLSRMKESYPKDGKVVYVQVVPVVYMPIVPILLRVMNYLGVEAKILLVTNTRFMKTEKLEKALLQRVGMDWRSSVLIREVEFDGQFNALELNPLLKGIAGEKNVTIVGSQGLWKGLEGLEGVSPRFM